MGVGDVNSTQESSSTLVGGGGGSVPVVVYALLGVGAAAPVVLVLIVVVVLRSRRTARHATRRRVTYNSAPSVDVVVRAWNAPIPDGTPNSKPTVVGTADAVGSRSNLSADGRQGTGTLSELAVREFFDVQDRQACQLHVSVEPLVDGRSTATLPDTAAPSTPGCGAWTSGSESSGEMERRAGDLLTLIGPATVRTKNVQAAAATDDDETTTTIRNQSSSDGVPVQHAPSVGFTASRSRTAGNGSCPVTGSGPTVHTIVVDVEPPPVSGLPVETGGDCNGEDDGRTPPPVPWPSRMRRSDACYDIAQLSTTPPVDVPDSPRSASSKSSSPLSPAAPPSPATNGCSNDTETKPTEDLVSEEEKALKALDAIAYDYDDHEELREPKDWRVTSSV